MKFLAVRTGPSPRSDYLYRGQLNLEHASSVLVLDLCTVHSAPIELAQQPRPESHRPEGVVGSVHDPVDSEEVATETHSRRPLTHGVDIELADMVARRAGDGPGGAWPLHPAKVVDAPDKIWNEAPRVRHDELEIGVPFEQAVEQQPYGRRRGVGTAPC